MAAARSAAANIRKRDPAIAVDRSAAAVRSLTRRPFRARDCKMRIFAITLSNTVYVQEDDKTNYYALELLRTPSARNGQAIRASVYATREIV